MKIRGVLAVMLLSSMTLLAQSAPAPATDATKPSDHAACKQDKGDMKGDMKSDMKGCKRDMKSEMKGCCKHDKDAKEAKAAACCKKDKDGKMADKQGCCRKDKAACDKKDTEKKS